MPKIWKIKKKSKNR